MSLPGPARRFYEESHHRQLRTSSEDQQSVADVIGEMNSPGHRYNCVYNYLAGNAGLNVCELGAAGGARINGLANLCSQFTAVDIVNRLADDGGALNLRFVRADLNEDFPFADGEFDTVIAMMVIEHLFDPFHSFRETARICKPNGRVFINLPNIASIRCRLDLLCGRMPVTSSGDWFRSREWDGNHLHNFTIANVVRIAELFGLRLAKLHPIGNLLPLKRLRPSLFCHEISFVFIRT
jgi:2-polyprenyl-3-methyl-5-hydroxy-6-metoxy-1,4-benzoquinol methylase